MGNRHATKLLQVLQPITEIQYSLDCGRENDRGDGALCDINAGQRLDERSGEDNLMGFDRGSEIPTSI